MSCPYFWNNHYACRKGGKGRRIVFRICRVCAAGLLTVLFCGLSTGCMDVGFEGISSLIGNEQSIVGEWIGENGINEQMAEYVDFIWDFKADGTFTTFGRAENATFPGNMSGRWSRNGDSYTVTCNRNLTGIGTMSIEGTATIEGNRMTVDFSPNDTVYYMHRANSD
ncbi:MAG: hypothetical protein IKQ36_01935 [Clostridia bacterium]|nr:hypothetical protein [Clostridia bacterium]